MLFNRRFILFTRALGLMLFWIAAVGFVTSLLFCIRSHWIVDCASLRIFRMSPVISTACGNVLVCFLPSNAPVVAGYQTYDDPKDYDRQTRIWFPHSNICISTKYLEDGTSCIIIPLWLPSFGLGCAVACYAYLRWIRRDWHPKKAFPVIMDKRG